MKKVTLALAIVLSLITPTVLSVGATYAADPGDLIPSCTNDSSNGRDPSTLDVCKDVNNADPDDNPIIKIIKIAIDIISYAVGAAAVILILVSAIQFVTAGGDPQAVAKARSSVVYALVGVAIVALSQTIVVFALNKIG